MKTITEKEFDAVKYMRGQREKLSGKLSQMTKEEIVKSLFKICSIYFICFFYHLKNGRHLVYLN